MIWFPFTHVEGCFLSISPPHLLQALLIVKLDNFITEASTDTYFVPLRKGGKENEIKNTSYFHLKWFSTKNFFRHHYSFLDFLPYFIGNENSAGPKYLNDFSIYSGGTYQREHKHSAKSYPGIGCTPGIMFFQIYEYVRSLFLKGWFRIVIDQMYLSSEWMVFSQTKVWKC